MPTRWSKKRNNHLRAATLFLWAALIPVMLSGCVEEVGDVEPQQEALQEEADRRGESTADDIREIDDERSVERRIHDATVAAKVRTALVEAKELRPFDFDPVVVNGHVMLRGEVRTQDQRRRAENVAEDVDGVRGVVNEISATDEPTPDEPADAGRDSAIVRMDDAATPETTSISKDTASAAEPSTDQDPDDASQDDDAAVYHTVRSGESLWTIARSNGVTIDQIRQLNGLGSNNRIKPGQRLRVK